MRTPPVVWLFTCLLAVAPAVSGQIPAGVQSALDGVKGQLPLVGKIEAALKPDADGCYLARDVPLPSGSVTLVVYHPKGCTDDKRFDVALVMTSFSLGTLWQGFNSTFLAQLELDHPVVIYSQGPKDQTERVAVSQLPTTVRNALAVSADEVFLEKGLNISSRLVAEKSMGEAVDLLKDIGIDLKDVVIQSSIGATKTVLLRRKGEWKNPFHLKNATLTDATLYMASTKTGTKSIAGWGNVTIGSTKAFIYAERTKSGKTVLGDTYGLNSQKLTLQAVTDLMEAIPDNPFPTAGLASLPLDRIELTNPQFTPVTGSNVPDQEHLKKFTVFIATKAEATTPDGTKGPCLYANGSAIIFDWNAASLKLLSDQDQFVMTTKVASPQIGDVRLGSTDFLLKNTKSQHELSFSGALDAKVCGYELAKEKVTVYASDRKFKFTARLATGGLAGAAVSFTTGDDFNPPWKVTGIDVTGIAGEVFDRGLDAYRAARDEFQKTTGIPVVDPEKVAWALGHADNFAKASTWIDIGKSADASLRDLAGKVFRSADDAVAAASKLGKELLGRAGDAASDAEGTASGFCKKVGHAVKKLFHIGSRGHHKKKQGSKASEVTYAPSEVLWNGRVRPNLAYNKPVTASSEEKFRSIKVMGMDVAIPPSKKEFTVDGKDNPPSYVDETTFVSTEEVFPWVEIDLGQEYKVETIIIQTPENAAPKGLDGYAVAVGARGGSELMDPANKPFYVKAAGSYVVIQPSMTDPNYKGLREATEASALKYFFSKLEKKVGGQEAERYHADLAKLVAATRSVRYIRVFLPGKGRLAITEIRVLALPEGEHAGLFMD